MIKAISHWLFGVCLVLIIALVNGENKTTTVPVLQSRETATVIQKSAAGFIGYLEQGGGSRNIAKEERKKSRVSTTLSYMRQMFDGWQPAPSSPNHTRSNEVIFTTAISATYGCNTARLFAGTARGVGFKGDIVVAILPNSKPHFVECLRTLDVIIYVADMHCEGTDVGQVCSMPAIHNVIAPVTFFRYYFYSYWASVYSTSTVILLADFRDTFFQSNPFQFKPHQWYPPVADLVLFEENYPLKVIYRDVYLQTYIRDCYGESVLKLIGSNTIVTSGLVVGNRDGIVTYVTSMLQQNDPAVRHKFNSSFVYDPATDRCRSPGMDQGFHNWLVHSGQLGRSLVVKKYAQGEGLVNSIGSFAGHRSIIKRSLMDWKILVGDGRKKKIVNWTGDLSPMVHQADRLLSSDLSPRLEDHFDIIAQALKGPVTLTAPTVVKQK